MTRKRSLRYCVLDRLWILNATSALIFGREANFRVVSTTLFFCLTVSFVKYGSKKGLRCMSQEKACTFDRVRGRRKQAVRSRSKQTSESSLSERLRKVEEALAQTLASQSDPLSRVSKHFTSSSLPVHDNSESPATESGKEPTPVVVTQPEPSDSSMADCESIVQPESLTTFVPSPSAVSYGQLHFGGCHFGHLSQNNGLPLISDQDKTVVETIWHVFSNSSFRLVFPVVDPELFYDTINLAYMSWSGETPSLEHMSQMACVLAFASMIPLFQGSLVDLPPVDTDICAAKARYILTDVLEVPNLATLQVAFMLNMHEVFLGRLRSASMFHAIACRMAFTLGGQNYTATETNKGRITHHERERRQIRLLFWLLYIFDKNIALRSGQPPLMSEDYCDLTLPENYLECYEYLPGLSHHLPLELDGDTALAPHLPGDPRLSHIKEKASRLLYSAQAARKTPAQLLFDIRDLDDELETWRKSIPQNFRPQLSIRNNYQVNVENMHLPRSMRSITLHLEYHHLLATIHRASGRCMHHPEHEKSNIDAEWPSNIESGVESSIALALEASRSTLLYLMAATDGLAGEAFWVVVFYPTTAMITIFFNILMHPLRPSAKSDLELLKSSSDLIKKLPSSHLRPQDERMEMINDFCMELVRLASSAINKAVYELDQEREIMPPTNI
ncbi:hypothetical protein FPSE_12005 [Fusarium pseudograminearum CS3096]|uniref:Xylanolytic transcriptional activator regulatory domain-containing protein n=1 Tax=Fusarium pseudograminearum (strain CS3096) TaxID=1028729 RepID=K3V480_FUSPC|nr:hypothetical protein FPSE_12005 [Fusarium pseudograminearum CS3096]EKJ67857.1 hypothetical protein FPSE_12005 [Fusarium pseudograminearum CS3096]